MLNSIQVGIGRLLTTLTPFRLSANQWIEQLAGFREFLLNLRNVPELRVKPSVKVALLDDGVRLDVLKNKPRGLQSFHSDGHEYFVGSCSHGTAMARCIQEVCPMVELYIARLDTSRRDENQTFTTASCYQVCTDALFFRKLEIQNC